MSDARPVGLTVLLLIAGLAALLVTARLAAGPGPTSRSISVAQLAPVDAQVPKRVVAPPTRGTDAPVDVARSWVAVTARHAGIPEVAVAAYGRATLVTAVETPGCRLGWTTLAGIGYVESRHGTLEGRTLWPDGRSSSPILGPALDGDRFAAIPATRKSTVWHGDPTWDHAVGPLQFIPSTWAQWAADGDSDGQQDPNDLFDAALAAARYLCAAGADLVTTRGWTGAVREYNHSEGYVRQVLVAANAYAARAT